MMWVPTRPFWSHTSQPRKALGESMRLHRAPVGSPLRTLTHAVLVKGSSRSKSAARGMVTDWPSVLRATPDGPSGNQADLPSRGYAAAAPSTIAVTYSPAPSERGRWSASYERSGASAPMPAPPVSASHAPRSARAAFARSPRFRRPTSRDASSCARRWRWPSGVTRRIGLGSFTLPSRTGTVVLSKNAESS